MCLVQSQYKGGGRRPPPQGGGPLCGFLWPPLPSIDSLVLALSKVHFLALNIAHVLRLNKADVLALNKAHVLRLDNEICPEFTTNTRETTKGDSKNRSIFEKCFSPSSEAAQEHRALDKKRNTFLKNASPQAAKLPRSSGLLIQKTRF